jgi:hypothetical protein
VRVPLQQQPATCWESLSGKGDTIAKRRQQRQWGRAKETMLGIQCWPQQRLVPWRWYCPPNACNRPGSKRGNTIAVITSNGQGGWRGRLSCNTMDPGKRLKLLRGMLLSLSMAGRPHEDNKPAMDQQRQV